MGPDTFSFRKNIKVIARVIDNGGFPYLVQAVQVQEAEEQIFVLISRKQAARPEKTACLFLYHLIKCTKAFKYLCDLSEFNGDVTRYLAEGFMDGEKRMWNVVRMGNGNFYLVDVTNSDTGSTGENGGLFLTEASGSGQKYVVSHDGWQITYIYREDQEGLFTDGYLPISAAYVPDNDVPASAPSSAPAFTDVTYSWLVDPVAWALEHDITNGITDTTFEPDTDCNRGQIITFLYRAYL